MSSCKAKVKQPEPPKIKINWLKFCLVLAFLTTGLAMVLIGVWTQIKLNKVLVLTTDHGTPVSFVLMFIGLLVMMLGIISCCFIFTGQPLILYAYSVLLLMVLVLDITCGVSLLISRKRWASNLEDGLNTTLVNYRTPEGHSKEMDAVQQDLQCCGVHGYSEWLLFNPPVPQSCAIPPNCDTSNIRKIYREGCYGKIINTLIPHVVLAAQGVIMLAIFPFCGIFLFCFMAMKSKKSTYQEVK